MLIGLGVLFLVDGVPFWPWILVVIALASLPYGIARGGVLGGLLASGWLTGLALVFAFDVVWPGILVLIGVMMLLSAVVRNTR